MSQDYQLSSSSAPVDGKVQQIIQRRLTERSKLKKVRNYGAADAIRDELREQYGVMIDDREREWRVRTDFVDNTADFNQFDDNFDDGSFDEEMTKLDAELSSELSAIMDEEEEDNGTEEVSAQANDDEEEDEEEEKEAEDDEYEYEYEEEEETEETEDEGADDNIVAETNDEEEDDEYEYEYYEEEEDEDEDEADNVASLSAEELTSLTVVQLKEKLKESGLAVSGKKSDLVNRLLAN